MIPMLPAKAVISVLVFLVIRLLRNKVRAVKKDMEVLLRIGLIDFAAFSFGFDLVTGFTSD
jgi:hypothetical protein